MALLLIGVVVQPDAGNADIFHPQQTFVIADGFQILDHAREAWVGLVQHRKLTGIEIVVIAIESKPKAVIENRTPM